jgi:phosphatidylinositol glycan class C protein
LRLNIVDVKDLMLFYVIPLTFVAYLAKLIKIGRSFGKIKKDLIDLIKFVSFTYGLSPILTSLTESISSDTIYATVCLMLFLNLLFHDYYSTQVAMYEFFFINFLI